MIVLLPTPREIRYSDSSFPLQNGVQLFLGTGDDAALEVLNTALKRVALRPQKPLPEQNAATLVLAVPLLNTWRKKVNVRF